MLVAFYILFFIVWLASFLVNYSLLRAIVKHQGVVWTRSTKLISIALAAYSIPMTALLLVSAVSPIDRVEDWLNRPAKW